MQYTHTSIQIHTHTHTRAVPRTHVRCRCGGRHAETRASLITSSLLSHPPFSPLTSQVQGLEGGAGGEHLGQRHAGCLSLRALQHVEVACRTRPAHVHTYTNTYPSVIVYLSQTHPKTRTARHSRVAGGIVLATPLALPSHPLSLLLPCTISVDRQGH